MGRFSLQALQDEWRQPQDDERKDEDDELPHPIPFSPNWGRTRFSLYPPDETCQERPKRCYASLATVKPYEQQYPPLSQYWDSSTISTQSILDYSLPKQELSDDDDMKDILQMLQGTSITEDSPKHVQVQNEVALKLKQLSDAAGQEYRKVEQWREAYQHKKERQNKEAFNALRSVLKADHEAAKAILQMEKQQQKEQEERERQQEEEAKREEEAKEVARQRAVEKEEERKREQESKKEKEQLIRAEREREIAEKFAHVTKAREEIEKLALIRQEVAPFDTNKAVSKRRMNMKRMCRGKVNTLAADVAKVQTVAVELIEAIKAEKEQDDLAKQQLEQGDVNVTPDMARGQLYFLDLLASSAIVRIQAEGFNGPRGDGFPLAAFLATVAKEIPQFGPILEAHVFTVCPMAIPTLPRPSDDLSEDDLMESLGMIKNKNGDFESFERFLQRTEGIISIVADIMSSHPENHKLFGGHEGATQWLGRFLEALPPSPEQLPLITAPLLEGFLIGAGHMMAKIHPDEFRKLLNIVTGDIVKRLDEGAIGAPRAHRLKESVKNGFEGFQNDLPSKALAPFYNDGRGGPPPAPPPGQHSPLGVQASHPFGVSQVGNPFGGTQTSNNPFGGGMTANSNAPASNPFGGAIMATFPFGGNSASTFGQSNQAANSPFDTNGGFSNDSSGMMDEATEPTTSNTFGNSPFGVFGSTQVLGPNPSPFGSTAPSPSPVGAPSTFGSTANSTSYPFGGNSTDSSPFGTGGQQTPFSGNPGPSPFGAFGARVSAPNPSPFGSAAPSPSPFGASTAFGSSGNSASNPFGRNDSNSHPFGTGGQQTPFTGNPNQSPFGNQNQGFGDSRTSSGNEKKIPCKFFAQGNCKYGNNCRFSHDVSQGGNQGANTFGFGKNNSSFGSSPFGGPRR